MHCESKQSTRIIQNYFLVNGWRLEDDMQRRSVTNHARSAPIDAEHRLAGNYARSCVLTQHDLEQKPLRHVAVVLLHPKCQHIVFLPHNLNTCYYHMVYFPPPLILTLTHQFRLTHLIFNNHPLSTSSSCSLTQHQLLRACLPAFTTSPLLQDNRYIFSI